MTTMRDGDGRRVTVRARQGGPQNIGQSLNAVRLEQERLADWQRLDDPQRHMVQAVVRSTLRRLLENPGWIPASVRLGQERLDVFFVVELDVDQVDAAAAVQDLELEAAIARQEMVEMEEMLAAAAEQQEEGNG